MKTENLSTLKIHKLSKEQYDRELAAGRIDETALYLTPDDAGDLDQFVTVDQLDAAIAAIPTPDVSGQISTHNTDTEAHADIRQFVTDSITQIPTPDVSGQINTHNSNTSAHPDIRNSISSHTANTSNPHGVTAAQIGAAPTTHYQAASTITAGTFAGQVVASSAGQTPTTSCVRNSRLVATDTNPTVNGEIVWIYG